MTININLHKKLVLSHGEQVTHYKSQLCTCSTDGLPENADLNCIRCKGLGVYWFDPKTITAIVTGLDSDRTGRQWLQNGIALPEDMSCSASPGLTRRFKDYDKIIPKWNRGFPYPGELLQRGSKDRLLYVPMGNFIRISKINPVTGVETVWVKNTDFVIGGDLGKTVQWVAGRGPGMDDIYAVTYEPRFEFICWAPPAPRWERGRDLGQRIILRKIHLPWPASNWA